jgi:hypothetical protein
MIFLFSSIGSTKNTLLSSGRGVCRGLIWENYSYRFKVKGLKGKPFKTSIHHYSDLRNNNRLNARATAFTFERIGSSTIHRGLEWL